jgi:monothiol glutaredoxin
MTPNLESKIRLTIAAQRVVLFMKGTKDLPQCGFSAQVVGILKRRGVEFLDVNVLADSELRQGLKEFSKWPTFPQLYVDGKLVGGADLVTGLDVSGELSRVLS